MDYSCRLLLLLCILSLVFSSTFAQKSGDYHRFENIIYFDEPSVEDLSFIKERNETVSVLFTAPNASDDIKKMVESLETKFKDRLLSDGFTLKSGSFPNFAQNDIELTVDVLRHKSHKSYVTRLFLMRDVFLDENDVDYEKPTITIWKRMYFGSGNNSELSNKIRENILDGVNEIMKALNRK